MSPGRRPQDTLPRSPEGKGKLERVFRTIQKEVLREPGHCPVQTLEELNARLGAWTEEVCHAWVHEETGRAPGREVGPTRGSPTPHVS